jgi:hypothetical protein
MMYKLAASAADGRAGQPTAELQNNE